MPFAIPALLQTLWGLRYLVLAVALTGAFAWYTLHERHLGEAAVKAAVAQATEAEHQRRLQVEEWAQQWAVGAVNHVNQLETTDAQLQANIARLSAAHDAAPCLSRDSIDRLRDIGRPAPGH